MRIKIVVATSFLIPPIAGSGNILNQLKKEQQITSIYIFQSIFRYVSGIPGVHYKDELSKILERAGLAAVFSF